MSETATQSVRESATSRLPGRGATLSILPSAAMAAPTNTQVNQLRRQFTIPTSSPINQNGSFEFDRVIKSGYVQKRTQKTKSWKSVYIVLRPSVLSVYKSDTENNLRRKIFTSELSAVTILKDPKNKCHNLFGLFSSSRNYHFEAPTLKDAQEWTNLIKEDARIEEEEQAMFFASHMTRRQTFAPVSTMATELGQSGLVEPTRPPMDNARPKSSSPELADPRSSRSAPSTSRRLSHHDYSGLSGNEMASQSDLSDNDGLRAHGASLESLRARQPGSSATQLDFGSNGRPILGNRNASQLSGLIIENDPDRVVWQGWLWRLSRKGGVKQWKNRWAVIRPRNMILYKNESEYKASFILSLSVIINVVDINPVSKTKMHCFQVITDEKSYRFCAHDEEALIHCLGAFKSLLSKRRELEARQLLQGT
ncbi:PH domain-containing protein [Hypoxylon crocopeplum]|nr:PH domain-containing protein [Hypoxylon crocopeplum]